MTEAILDKDTLAATDARAKRGLEESSYESGGLPTRRISQSVLKRELSSLATFGVLLTGSSEHSAKSDMNGTPVELILPNRIYVSDSWGTDRVLTVEVPNETWTVPCFRLYHADLMDYLQRDRLAMGSPLAGSPQQRQHSFWTPLESEYRRFRRQLIGSLSEEPIEDGISHPAERLIQQSLLTDAASCRDWLSRILVENYPIRAAISASIVRCIGRLDYHQAGRWGLQVVDDALRHIDVEVREAAVRALEAWGGDEALGVLRQHADPEAWMREYVRRVVEDLSNATP